MTTTRSDALNDALERLEDYRHLDGEGFPTHGPMGAEALSSLGHDDEVAGWVEWYKAHHVPIPAPAAKDPIDPADESSWRPALGDFVRITDWDASFRRQLGDAAWVDVVRAWVPRLLPGYGGMFTHGLVRTGHAVRALDLEVAPSGLLLDELARGLALWATSYRELPGEARLDGRRTLVEALEQLPRIGGDVVQAATFARVGEIDGFGEAVAALGPPPSADEALSDLTAAFCRMMLAHPEMPATPFVHTVTPVTVGRSLLGVVDELSATDLYARAWHVNAGLAAGFTDHAAAGESSSPDADGIPTEDELLGRAVEHRDPHVLKFTEAAVREHAHRPDPVYLRAAQRVIEQTPRH